MNLEKPGTTGGGWDALGETGRDWDRLEVSGMDWGWLKGMRDD